MTLEKEINEKEINLIKYLNIFLKRRKIFKYLFIRMFLIIMIFSCLFFILSKQNYKITTAFMPSINLNQMQRLENLTGIVQYESKNFFAEEKNIHLYLCQRILGGKKIIIPLLEKKYLLEKKSNKLQTLAEIFKIHKQSKKEMTKDIYKIFKKSIFIDIDFQKNLIILSFITKYPYFGEQLINDLLNELNIILKEQDFNRLNENKNFIEERFKKVKENLINAESILYGFREKNRIINTPNLKLQEERLIRNVKSEESLFDIVNKENELAIIEAERNKTGIIILEKPTEEIISKKIFFKPKILIILIVVTFFIGILLAFLMEFIENLKKDDEEFKIFCQEILKIKENMEKKWMNLKKILNFEK